MAQFFDLTLPDGKPLLVNTDHVERIEPGPRDKDDTTILIVDNDCIEAVGTIKQVFMTVVETAPLDVQRPKSELEDENEKLREFVQKVGGPLLSSHVSQAVREDALKLLAALDVVEDNDAD